MNYGVGGVLCSPSLPPGSRRGGGEASLGFRELVCPSSSDKNGSPSASTQLRGGGRGKKRRSTFQIENFCIFQHAGGAALCFYAGEADPGLGAMPS